MPVYDNLPPPYPPNPSDVETLPCIDQGERVGRLVKEIVRVRKERDEALAALREQPPDTPWQTFAKIASKWTALVTLLPYLGAWAAKRWPDHSDLITILVTWVKTQL
jgi:hypothetical protein